MWKTQRTEETEEKKSTFVGSNQHKANDHNLLDSERAAVVPTSGEYLRALGCSTMDTDDLDLSRILADSQDADDDHFPPRSTTSRQPPEILAHGSSDHEDLDFLPPSLASFINQAQTTFIESKDSFFKAGGSPECQATEIESTASSPSHKIQEDEQDRHLKGEMLERLESSRRSTSETDGNALLSPQFLTMPPLNRTELMTDTQVKQAAPKNPLTPPVVEISVPTDSKTASEDQRPEGQPLLVDKVEIPDQKDIMKIVSAAVVSVDGRDGSGEGLVTKACRKEVSTLATPDNNVEKAHPPPKSKSTEPVTSQVSSVPVKEVSVPVTKLPSLDEGKLADTISASPGLARTSNASPSDLQSKSKTDSKNKTPASSVTKLCSSTTSIPRKKMITPRSNVSSRLLRGTSASKSREKSSRNFRAPVSAPKETSTSDSPASSLVPASSVKRTPTGVPIRLLRETAASRAHKEDPSRLATPSDTASGHADKHISPVMKTPANRKSGFSGASSRLYQETASTKAHKYASPSSTPPATAKSRRTSRQNIQSARSVGSGEAYKTPGPCSPARATAKKPAYVPNRLLCETACSRARVTSAPTTPGAPNGSTGGSSLFVQNAVSSDPHDILETPLQSPKTSSSKALDRTRQRTKQLKQEERHDDPSSVMKKPQPPKISAEEAMARARERIRKRLMQEKASTTGKENRLKSNANAARKVYGRVSGNKRRPVTVPQAPKFATTARIGEWVPPRKSGPALAQSTDVLRKGLRGDLSLETQRGGRHRSGKPGLTAPQTPRFATNARHGEKAPTQRAASDLTIAQSTDLLRKGLRDDSSAASSGSHHRSTTIPHAPDFATTKKYGEKLTPPRGGLKEMTWAQSTDVLRKGLREEFPMSTARERKLTIPNAPKFHATVKRRLPKSIEEKEKEMMNFYKTHPFKARPVGMNPPQKETAVKPLPKKQLTKPEPFHLRLDDRAANPKPSMSTEKAVDSAETKKQFKARPMPSFKETKSLTSHVASKKTKPSLTKPKPFNLSQGNKHSSRVSQNSQAEVRVPFRARPPPETTYRLNAKPKVSTAASMKKTTDVKEFSLQTSSRTEKRHAVEEASRRKAELLKIAKKEQAKNRQREKHAAEMLKAQTPSPSPPSKPFALRSNIRHEEYRKQLEEKLKQEELEFEEGMKFHARSFASPPRTPRVLKLDHKKTEPEPFHLSSLERHEAFEEDFRSRISEEEEKRKRDACFKAKPVPKTTYDSTANSQVSPAQKPNSEAQALAENTESYFLGRKC